MRKIRRKDIAMCIYSMITEDLSPLLLFFQPIPFPLIVWQLSQLHGAYPTRIRTQIFTMSLGQQNEVKGWKFPSEFILHLQENKASMKKSFKNVDFYTTDSIAHFDPFNIFIWIFKQYIYNCKRVFNVLTKIPKGRGTILIFFH